ncbi:MAG: 50S ribosomal protein L3 [Myxococcota bacterium]|nr:50S ribosomal protein L3 [Myxococcota bacterium]
MAIELQCRKLGMTQVFDERGTCIPVTVLSAEPNVVVQVKTEATDGYPAVQLGYGERRASLFNKPARGHFEKANTAPRRHLKESRIEPEAAESYTVGSEIRCDIFEAGQVVDVIGSSKGRGTAGVIKRHNFSVKRRTHGTHENTRHGGAIGAGAYPGKVIKGMKMSGRMGNESVTVRNLIVVKVDADQNLIFVRGGVPGHRNGVVRIRAAVAPR